MMSAAMPKEKEILADKATMPIGSAPPSQSAASPRASRRNSIGRSRSPVTLLYKQRHKIENMFERLKDWRPVHTRYEIPRKLSAYG